MNVMYHHSSTIAVYIDILNLHKVGDLVVVFHHLVVYVSEKQNVTLILEIIWQKWSLNDQVINLNIWRTHKIKWVFDNNYFWHVWHSFYQFSQVFSKWVFFIEKVFFFAMTHSLHESLNPFHILTRWNSILVSPTPTDLLNIQLRQMPYFLDH